MISSRVSKYNRIISMGEAYQDQGVSLKTGDVIFMLWSSREKHV
tara:strand:- start:955 stop:1086 length:132 start_codon:yes stop_codon:yes gene_type:complete